MLNPPLRRIAPTLCRRLAQERLIAVVAGHLLDCNAEERLSAAVGEEYRSNLARNLADAIDLLPKLVRTARDRITAGSLDVS